MNNLYNSLINGSAYTNDAGQVVVTPPTALNLRAAKVLKQIADINDNNVGVITQLQQREQASMVYANNQLLIIERLTKQVNELTKEKESYAKKSESNGSENIFADKSGEAA
mgnify:CR=1 FL=1